MIEFTLLRGLGRESGHWGKFPELLKKSFPDCTVHCVDIPGSGAHLNEKSPLLLKKTAAAVKRHWQSKKCEKSVVLGVSLGGMIALEWIHQAPQDFTHAVIVNSSIANLSWPLKRLQLPTLRMFANTVMAAGPEQREKAVLDFIANHPEAQKEALPAWAQVQKDRPISAINSLRQIISAAAFRLKSKPTIPCLVLASTRDRLCDPSCSLDLAKYLDSPIAFHPTAGHDLTTDDPQWVIEQLKNFLA